ncbi:hypothetical protein QFC22_005618 [Naganishia vaughanmartiniae]|uniref:Uncharacterized protein n=1 Tax=Naganishia vaughanmartiniae TaxID=1424756 RepID=A0ACC2WSY1_9TREE|nr:hypothetical protein QFC22_005618 [Naganishia vaughanmartiniae]
MSEIDWLDREVEQFKYEPVKDGGWEELDADIDRWVKSQAEVQQLNKDVRRGLDNILVGMFADLL